MNKQYEKTKQYEIEDGRFLNPKQQEILDNYQFPKFEYYANPKLCDTLIVDEEDKPCSCCGEIKHVLFECDGCYGDFPEGLVLCPECIASGKAGKKFNIEFGLVYEFDYDTEMHFDKIDDEEKKFKATKCIPPILTCNDMEFRTHCGDYAEYMGPVYWQDIKNLGKQGIKDIKEDLKLNHNAFHLKLHDLKKINPDNEDYDIYLHLYRCKHCGKYLLQIDLD